MDLLKRFIYIAFSMALIAMAAACSKGSSDPAADDNQLIVSFTSAGVPITSTDSMITLFINGADTIKRKAIRGGTFYSVTLAKLESGTYKTVNKIYTAADSNGLQHMYRYETSVNSTANANLVGPTGNQFDLWKDNMFFHNDEYKINFAIAISPADPYYEITLPASLPFKNVFIDRNGYGTQNKVKYALKHATTVVKASDYKGFHSNTTTFATFSATNTAGTYTSADASLQLYNEVNNDYKIIFQHEVKF